jgi:hypothetical protein
MKSRRDALVRPLLCASGMKLLPIVLLVAGCPLDSSDAHLIHDGDSRGLPGTCTDPEGPLHVYADAAELDQLFVGRWLHCTGPTITDQDVEVGLELTAERDAFVLVHQDGNVVRAGGFAGQGTWDVDYTTRQLDVHMNAGDWINIDARFEDNPRRFQVLPIYKTPAIYVQME